MNFSKDIIVDQAVELVREKGWGALSARSLAARIGCSVIPIYSTVGSMDAVKGAVVDACVGLAMRRGEHPYTDCRYVNHGVGFITLARDEANLFLALIRHGVSYGGFDRYHSFLRELAHADPRFAELTESQVDILFERHWVYTFGLAVSFFFSVVTMQSNREIIEHLVSAGSVLIYGVLSGLSNCGSDESVVIWEDLFKKIGVSIPSVGRIKILE